MESVRPRSGAEPDGRLSIHHRDDQPRHRAPCTGIEPVTCLARSSRDATIHRTHHLPPLVGFAACRRSSSGPHGRFATRIGASWANGPGATVSRKLVRAAHMPRTRGAGLAYRPPCTPMPWRGAERPVPGTALPASPGFHKGLDDPGMIPFDRTPGRKWRYVIPVV